MSEWVAISDFINDDIVDAASLRPIINGINFLHRPRYEYNYVREVPADQTTASSTMIAVTQSNYAATIETEGRPVLVIPVVEMFSSVTTDPNRVGLGIFIDDVANKNSTNASYLFNCFNGASTPRWFYNSIWIVQPAAGSHEFQLGMLAADAATVTLNGTRRNSLFVLEL